MSFKCGIVGLPNIGKSTLFNALTKSNIEAINYPFCTINPNIGWVSVPDYRLEQLADIVKPNRVIPPTIEIVDIAGLVKGASQGIGLGNKFLTNIRETEVICHVVRCFENDEIIHIAGKVNPVEDIDIINTELLLSDLEICERAIWRVQKQAKSSNKDAKIELNILEKCLSYLNNYILLRLINLSNYEKNIIRYLNFLTIKPTIYIANVDENGFIENIYLDKVSFIAKNEGSVVIAVCIKLESDIANLNKKDRLEFINELNIKNLSLNHIISTCYNLLNFHTYFTVGNKEICARSIPIGATASQVAGKIHTDFEKGFICAQTISFDDFIIFGGEEGVKSAGKMRFEGRKYIVQDGDIINFLFNV